MHKNDSTRCMQKRLEFLSTVHKNQSNPGIKSVTNRKRHQIPTLGITTTVVNDVRQISALAMNANSSDRFSFAELPEDVGRLIFQAAAELSGETGRSCALVSKKINSWWAAAAHHRHDLAAY